MKVIVGVGSGLTAGAAAGAGADAIACYSTAMYRIKGLPTALSFLPYDDCNALTLGVLPEVRNAVPESTPLIVGVGAHDPRVNLTNQLAAIRELGGTGVMNEPFIGMYGAAIRAALDAAQLGIEREYQLIRVAVAAGMVTLGWAFNDAEATRLAGLGVTYLGAMAGIMADGEAGPNQLTRTADELGTMAAAARAENRAVVVLGHGGPLNSVENCRQVVAAAELDGVVTGSNGERVPTHRGIVSELTQLMDRS